ncbi:MAG: hypothetical protein VB142_07870, partial [Burkholderia sp.]
AANVHDKHAMPQLLHGQEQRVYGDNAYASQKALIHGKAPKTRDFTKVRYRGLAKNANRAFVALALANVSVPRTIDGTGASVMSENQAWGSPTI